MRSREVLEAVAPWAKVAGYEVSALRPDVLVSADNHEILAHGDGSVVTVQVDGGESISSADFLVLEKYLCAKLGPRVRASMGFIPELVFRYDDLAVGWSLELCAGRQELWQHGVVVASIGVGATFANAVYLSHVLSALAVTVRGSFVNARGSHLFSPVDYFTREIPPIAHTHDPVDCGGPVHNPYLPLGCDASGWGDIRRCLNCGKYWMLVDRMSLPMTSAEIHESLPWEPRSTN